MDTSKNTQAIIPDEAVEAAAEAMRDKFSERAFDCWPDFQAEARAALEAAAPYMLESAWREGCAEGIACEWDAGAEFFPLNPYGPERG